MDKINELTLLLSSYSFYYIIIIITISEFPAILVLSLPRVYSMQIEATFALQNQTTTRRCRETWYYLYLYLYLSSCIWGGGGSVWPIYCILILDPPFEYSVHYARELLIISKWEDCNYRYKTIDMVYWLVSTPLFVSLPMYSHLPYV